MRALVTGASGFVGRWLVRHLLECGDEVVAAVFPHRSGASPADYFSGHPAGDDLVGTSHDSRLTLKEIDITDPEACARIIGAARPQVVYHLGGLAFVPDAEVDFKKTIEVNVAGTHNVVRVCHLLQSDISVVLVSSAEVYGKISSDDLPVSEATPVRPFNAYSLSKAMSELVGERFARLGNVRVVIVRPFNHIGPGQDEKFVTSSFAAQLARIATGENPAVLRVGNLEAQRDFSDVRDIVRAYRHAALAGEGPYVLGSGRPTKIRSILDELVRLSGLEIRIEQDPSRMRPAEMPIVYGSFEKARRDFGWEPCISLTQSLTDVFRWWQARIHTFGQ